MLRWIDNLTPTQFALLGILVGVCAFVPAFAGTLALLNRHGYRALPILGVGALACLGGIVILLNLIRR